LLETDDHGWLAVKVSVAAPKKYPDELREACGPVSLEVGPGTSDPRRGR
jgi:hypothetical protein